MTDRIDFKERLKIQEMLDHGYEIKEIAKTLERSASALSAEIKKAGGIRNYNAQFAQDLSDERKKDGNKGKNGPLQHLIKRVEELERIVNEILML